MKHIDKYITLIRSMSDEELKQWIIENMTCPWHQLICPAGGCEECFNGEAKE